MSVRFFGEYLVKKGVIKPASLVSALIDQMGLLPSISKVVFDNALVSPDKMIEIFHRQQTSGEDFVTAAQHLGVWNGDIAEKVEALVSKVRTPIGQILVQKGEIDLKSLTRHLDEFLAQAEVAAIAPMDSPVVVNDAAQASGSIEEEMYQPGIIAELEDMFDERKRRAVKVALSFIKDKNPPDSNVVSKLMNDSLKIVRTVLGLVKIFGVKNLGQLLQEMERVLDARRNAADFTQDQMQKVAGLVADAMEEAWMLRESISANCSEAQYLGDSVAKSRFDKLLAQLQEIK